MFFYRRRRGNLKVLFVLFFAMLGFKEISSAIRDFGTSMKTPVEYSSVDAWQIENGMFIEGDIPLVHLKENTDRQAIQKRVVTDKSI